MKNTGIYFVLICVIFYLCLYISEAHGHGHGHGHGGHRGGHGGHHSHHSSVGHNSGSHGSSHGAASHGINHHSGSGKTNRVRSNSFGSRRGGTGFWNSFLSVPFYSRFTSKLRGSKPRAKPRTHVHQNEVDQKQPVGPAETVRTNVLA